MKRFLLAGLISTAALSAPPNVNDPYTVGSYPYGNGQTYSFNLSGFDQMWGNNHPEGIISPFSRTPARYAYIFDIDSGFSRFPDEALYPSDNIRPEQGVSIDAAGNIVCYGNNINCDMADTAGHGTFSAYAFAERRNDNTGIAGLTKNVIVVPIKLKDGATNAAVAAALNYAAAFNNGGLPKVAYIVYDSSWYWYDNTLHTATENFMKAGGVPVYTMGNQCTNSSVCSSPNQYINGPADYVGLFVGNTCGASSQFPYVQYVYGNTCTGSLQYNYSNHGGVMNIVAPGTQASIHQQTNPPTNGYFTAVTGTSISAIHVAATAAWMSQVGIALPPPDTGTQCYRRNFADGISIVIQDISAWPALYNFQYGYTYHTLDPHKAVQYWKQNSYQYTYGLDCPFPS